VADASQISQVLTNVIKNASESVHESKKEGGFIKAKAKIGENIVITIDDNGKGFPEELMDRLTEPYVTTRQKGTGLGLAIVKKIMQDHNGKIDLMNIKGGARVVLTLPIL
jgi:two-component system nitrogen regulation sensor histidine kinase NtrY